MKLKILALLLILFSFFGHSSGVEPSFVFFEANETRITANIFTLCEDTYGQIWIGTKGGGIAIYDGYEFSFLASNPKQQEGLINNYILNIYKDSNDRMWVGTRQGVSIYDSGGSWLRNLHLYPEDPNDFANYAESFCQESNSRMWIGTQRGLYLYDFDKENLTSFHFQNKEFPEFNEDFFMRIEQDRKDKDVLWLASRYGLKKFHKVTESFSRVSGHPNWKKRFHPDNEYSLFDLKIDQNNKLYMAGYPNGGILTYLPSAREWHQYTYKDRHKELLLCTILPLSDGKLLYGAVNRIGLLNENEMLSDLPIPSGLKTGLVRDMILARNGVVWIASANALIRSEYPINENSRFCNRPILGVIEVNGSKVEKNNKLLIKRKCETLKLELRHINASKQDVNFRWKMNGFDNDWQVAHTSSFPMYTNLEGGSYLFEYESQVEGCEWREGSPIQIDIEKQSIERFFFYPMVIYSGIVVIVIVLFNSSINSKRKSAAQLKRDLKIKEAEMNALQSQMNPHFIFNSLNSIYNFIHENDAKNASDYLHKFATLMQAVLKHSEEKLVTLTDELDVIRLYLELESLRFEHKFEYGIELDEQIDTQRTFLPPLLIQPFLENSIWHGLMHKKTQGHLIVNIHFDTKESLLIEIIDDGIGRLLSKKINAGKNKISLGMQITKKRIENFEIIYGQKAHVQVFDLTDEFDQAAGTKVLISIPFINEKPAL